jgi:hypothetical protein
MSIIWKKCNIVLFLAIVIMLFLFQIVKAEEESTNSKTIVVIGTGIINENNIASAREKAISEGLVTAVGVVMADVVPLEIFVPNFQTLNEIIYTNTENFISGYRVLAETKHKNLYRVIVQAEVSVVKIKQELVKIGIMVREKETAKIKVIVEGTRVLSNFVKFRSALSSLDNVREIQSSEMKADKATVIVEYNGDVNTLAESLMLKSFESFGINISEVLPDQLRIVLVPVDETKEPKLPATNFRPEELKE